MCKVREVEGVLSMIMPPSSDRLWSGTPIIENFRFFLQNEQKYGKYIVQGLGSLSSRGWWWRRRCSGATRTSPTPPSIASSRLVSDADICVVFTTWIVAAAGREAGDPARERGSPAQHDRPPPLLQVLLLVLLHVLILVLLLDLLSYPPVPAFEILQVRLLVYLFKLPF